jgi:hypothetical protein
MFFESEVSYKIKKALSRYAYGYQLTKSKSYEQVKNSLYLQNNGVVQQAHSVYIMRVSEQFSSSELAGKVLVGG